MNNGNGNGDLASIIASAIQDKIQTKINPNDIEGLIEKKFEDFKNNVLKKELEAVADQVKSMTKRIVVENKESGKTKDVGLQHEIFPKILKLAAQRLNISLVGPAGSGKTTIAHAVADALELPFYSLSVGLQTTKTDLIGFIDASGKYNRTVLREAYENGGVFLLDEMDAGNPGVLTLINAMTANGVASFPDGMVKKHEDFIFIAASNTFGRGADRMYVGRNQLDAATLDRFVTVYMDYDEELELAISPVPEWTKKVQGIRKAVYELKQRLVISPRASINGGKMLLSGFSESEVLDMVVFKGVDQITKKKIMETAKARGWL